MSEREIRPRRQRSFEFRDGRGTVSLEGMQRSCVQRRLGEIALELQRFTVACQRLVGPGRLLELERAVIENLGKQVPHLLRARLEGERLPREALGLCQLRSLQPGDGEIAYRIEERRARLERALVACNRSLKIALAVKDRSEIVVRLCVRWVEPQQLGVEAARLAELAGFLQRQGVLVGGLRRTHPLGGVARDA